MKILVTGATGFIGSHIIEELSKQGLALKAAYRPGESFGQIVSDFLIDGLDLETFPLDLLDRNAVFSALKGCQILFHSEHLFSMKSRDKNRLYQINQIGTHNLMEAALTHGVEKVVYTSGIETLRAPSGQEIATEKDGVSLEDLKSHFEKSRYLAEREVMQYQQKGLPSVIVHPTVGLGARDNQSTPFGAYLWRIFQGKARFYLDTGFNLVDVIDIAKGHLLAAKRGKVGRRYILGNQNVYMLEILQHLRQISNQAGPKTALPFALAKFGNFLRGMVGFKGSISNSLINRLKTPLFYDPSLAQSELGMPQSNIWNALKRQWQDFQQS